MKKRKITLSVAIFIAIMMVVTIVLAACPTPTTPGETTTPPPPPPPALTGLAISPASMQTWTLGEPAPAVATRTFTANAQPAGATLPAIVWSSSNDAVITVSNTGVADWAANAASVQPMPEFVTITATGGGFSANVRINITVPTPPTPVEPYISVSPSAYVGLEVGDTLQAAIQSYYLGEATANFVWTATAGTGAVTVSDAGLITATAAGTATVTVTSGEVSANIAITVAAAGQRFAISTPEQFRAIFATPATRALHYFLTNDIDFADLAVGDEELGIMHTAIPTGGATWQAAGNAFTGSFDGRGFAIKNFRLNLLGERAAVFTEIAEGAVVRNVSFENFVMGGTGVVGGQTGVLTSALRGTAENIYVQGTAQVGWPADWGGWERGGVLVGIMEPTGVLRNIVVDIVRETDMHHLITGHNRGASSVFENIFILSRSSFTTGAGNALIAAAVGGAMPAAGNIINVNAFAADGLGAQDFSALPAHVWNFTADSLPTLRQRAVAGEEVAVTGNARTAESYTVAGPSVAFTGASYAFSVIVDTTVWGGTPTVSGTVDGEPFAGIEYISVTGPANAREFTFNLRNIAGDIVIGEVSGLARLLAVTLNNDQFFTMAGPASVLDGDDYEFTISFASGFGLYALEMVVGTGNDAVRTLLIGEGAADNGDDNGHEVLYGVSYEFDEDENEYTITIDADLIEGNFGLEAQWQLGEGAVVVSGERAAPNYVIEIISDGDEQVLFWSSDVDFTFTVTPTFRAAILAVDAVVTVEIVMPYDGDYETVILTGVRGEGNVFTFTLQSADIVGNIEIGEVSGIEADSWVTTAVGAINVSNATEWNNISSILGWQDATIVLTQNIDFTDVVPVPLGGAAAVVGNGADDAIPFRGTLDGRGFAMQNITLPAPGGGGWRWGFIRRAESATIRNIAFTNMTVAFSEGQSGMLIGQAMGTAANPTVLQNVVLQGHNTGGGGADWGHNGGLIGRIDGTCVVHVTNAVVNVTHAAASFGGIVGIGYANTAQSFTNVFVTGVSSAIGDNLFLRPANVVASQRTNLRHFAMGDIADVEEHFEALTDTLWQLNASALPTLIPNQPAPVVEVAQVAEIINGTRDEDNYTMSTNLNAFGLPNTANLVIFVELEELSTVVNSLPVTIAASSANRVITLYPDGSRAESAVFTLPARYIQGNITIGALDYTLEYIDLEGWTAITTAEEFNNINNVPGWHFRNFYLANSIDFEDVENIMPIGGDAVIGLHAMLPQGQRFRGTFDGRGHALLNVTMTSQGGFTWGLFRHLDGATVRNLALVNMTADNDSGAQQNGMLAGWVSGTAANPTLIENIFISGSSNGGAGAAGSGWLRSAALIGRTARTVAEDGVSYFTVRNTVINVTSDDVSFAAILAYAPTGAAAGLRTLQNNFVVTGGFTHHAGAGAPFTIQAGHWTAAQTTQSGNVAFAIADIGDVDFSALSGDFWTGNVADGATALPALTPLGSPASVTP